MKIIVLALSPYGVMAHYSSQFANSLQKKCDTIVILHPEGPRHLYTKEIKINYFRPKKYFKFPSPISYFKLYKLIAKINPDVIYDPIGSAFYWTAGIKPYLKKWPLTITLHDPKLLSGISFILKFFNKYLINKLNIKTADLILFMAQNAEKK